MLKMTADVHTAIKAHGQASYPYEGCGLLLGTAVNGDNIVSEIRPMENVWPIEEEKRVRFQINSDDMLKAELWAREQNLTIVGIFHSHPDEAPVASPRDLEWAAFDTFSYLITRVSQGISQESRCWRLLDSRKGFYEEEIKLIMEN